MFSLVFPQALKRLHQYNFCTLTSTSTVSWPASHQRMPSNIFFPHKHSRFQRKQNFQLHTQFLDFPCLTLELILRGTHFDSGLYMAQLACVLKKQKLFQKTDYYPRGPLWSQTHRTGLPAVPWHLSGETKHMHFVIKGRADASLNNFFYWLIKLDVAVTRRILLWCNQVTLCLRFCLISAPSKKSKLQRLSRSDCMNVNPHLMVLGQNILGPHAWGESGEGPARSWCVGAWGRKRRRSNSNPTENYKAHHSHAHLIGLIWRVQV